MAMDTTAPVQAVPDHIPPGLVWDNNLPSFVRELDDPYIAAARLHDGPPVIWSTNALFVASTAGVSYQNFGVV